MADALGCDVEDIKPNVSLIEGLDAESIDFLDMVFRLERAFKIKIPRGKIVENARGTLTDAEFEQNGIVTETGLKQLREYLSEVPADRFRTPTKVKDIPRLFTTETFCKLVIAAQREAKCSRRMKQSSRNAPRMVITLRPSRSSTASPSTSRRRARGSYACRGRRPSVPRRRSGGAARRVVDGAHRFSWPPVAALANETRFRSDVTPGDTLDLAVDISCDDHAVAYAGGPCRWEGRHRARRLSRSDAARRQFDSPTRWWLVSSSSGVKAHLQGAFTASRSRTSSAQRACRACRQPRRCTYPNRPRSSAIISRAVPFFRRPFCSTRRSASRSKSPPRQRIGLWEPGPRPPG
jgi:acyl carrier protein